MSNQSVHPIYLTAAGAVILTCGIAIASMTGVLPAAGALSGDQTALIEAQQTEAKAKAEEQAKAEAEAKALEEAKLAAEAAAAKADAARVAAQKAARASAQSSSANYGNYRAVSTAAAPCYNCGQVTSVNLVQKQGEGSGLGAVAGGVTGAVIGKQFGGGNGKKALTIAGAIGGAILGNKIEKDAKATAEYQVAVRLDDGSTQIFNYSQAPQWRQGDRVKVVNGQLLANL